jgi:hypothetical protein
MQLAHWISRTEIPWLVDAIPAWLGMWFAIFPTYETLLAQALAATLVVGSYYAARHVGGTANEGVAPEPDVAIASRLETPVGLPALAHKD